MDIQSFLNPPAQYRPIPFWSWNDKLEPERLKKQVRAFAQAGMGGFFMHSRPGIRTAFLSDDWFAAVNASVSEAADVGLEAWIYDESSYPSGFAGGFVPAKRPDLAQKWLTCRQAQENTDTTAEAKGLFLVTDKEYVPVDAHPSDRLKGHVLQFVVERHQGTSWFNGYPYVDLLHPDSAATFLEIAYEPYAARHRDRFGSIIPGVFTDEPHINPGGGARLPWTPDLPQAYRECYGEDLLSRLPELFLNLGDYSTTRYRYWRLVTRLFLTNWMKPVYEWCDRHGLAFTGHLWEHVFSPMHSGSLMAPFEYMHIPGIDLLGRDVANARLIQDTGVPRQMGDVHMVKVASSVAHQLDRPRVLSETYGGAGWDMSFETQKRYAEWEYALGVNLLNQHLSHYSLRGYRKHDYPISFLDHQPWWPDYRLLGDYFGRLSYALSQGRYEADLLILHPMASVWSEWRPSLPGSISGAGESHSPRQQAREHTIDTLLKTLSAANWSYDLGDDLIMEGHARVVTADDGAPCLQVGVMRYKAVVVPTCTNLAANTLKLLEDFVAKGGPVFLLPPLPCLIDGQPSDLRAFVNRCRLINSPSELPAHLELLEEAGSLQRVVRTSTSTPWAPIYHLVRRTEKGQFIFLANMGDVPHPEERVRLSGSGPVERWDLSTGAIDRLPACPDGDGICVTLDFAETESHLLFQYSCDDSAPAKKPNRSAGRHLPRSSRARRLLSDQWEFKRLDPNVMILDYAELRIGEELISECMPTQEIAYRLRQRYGLPIHPVRDVQPWLKHPEGPPVFDEQVVIRYRVQSDLPRPFALDLVVEDASQFEVWVNGYPVSFGDDSWLDPAFQRASIADNWIQGLNTITLRFRFHEDLPVEPAFLLGDFALRSDDGHNFRLCAETPTITSGPWIGQGYPFFVGRAVYSQSVELSESDLSAGVWLDLSDLPNVVTVHCNDHEVGQVAWRPYRLELTQSLRPGTNKLEVEVANSLHNALGPVHSPVLPDTIGPPHYTYHQGWTREYRLVSDGLAQRVSLLLSDD
ncbi:MAG: glycosylhydrolase-like jelly roll fold domain-containing protein [Limnochordia bacterium]|jgi:hypothetical protein